MSMINPEDFDDGSNTVWTSIENLEIDYATAQTIANNAMDVGKILAASGALPLAILGAVESAETPDEIVGEVMEGLIMAELVERDYRFKRSRKFLGRITGRQPLFYVGIPESARTAWESEAFGESDSIPSEI